MSTGKSHDLFDLRMVSWWLKWADLDWPSPDNLDTIRRRADELASSGVNGAFIFGTHFRWDFLPYWDILHDYMATVADELHRRDIVLYDHHSAILVHRYEGREQMRQVKLHSGPHLPFAPSASAAASWEFNGFRLNSWRQIDLVTGEPTYEQRYAAEHFCHLNPNFIESYLLYMKRLIAETGIDGLMCDDIGYANGWYSCGCEFCRQFFREHFGYELPHVNDRTFWGNWNNPDWSAYTDSRFDSVARFYARVRTALPSPDYPMLACCSSSCSDDNVYSAHDILDQLAGCNIVHLEMVGNTPPIPGRDAMAGLSDRIVVLSHHIAAARERNLPTIGLGFGFTEPCANVIWAMNKMLGANCWFSTLKARLGLSEAILNTLPHDAEPVTKAYNFEKTHPELFKGMPVTQVGIYFSTHTRKHTCMGTLSNGLTRDYADTLNVFFQNGLHPASILTIPASRQEISVIVIPTAAQVSQEEVAALGLYLASGGMVFATGPFGYPGLKLDWQLPTGVEHSIWHSGENWVETWGQPIPASTHPPVWTTIAANLFWHPRRIQDGDGFPEDLLRKLRVAVRLSPAQVVTAKGFFAMTHRDAVSEKMILHFVAATYDIAIDEHLDAIRYHRSRVNLIIQADPIDQDGHIYLQLAEGYHIEHVVLPFAECVPSWNGGDIALSKPAVYVIAVITGPDKPLA